MATIRRGQKANDDRYQSLIATLRDARIAKGLSRHCQRDGRASPGLVTRDMSKAPSPFRYFHSSPEIIRLAVLLYVRFPLSLRNVDRSVVAQWRKDNNASISVTARQFGLSVATVKRYCASLGSHEQIA